jgi:ubiquinone/menaquinone biosynthesis C-methylase UbiE
MSNPEELREYANTYLVQDRSNQEEMARLEVQDRMLTASMGGVLPELDDPTSLRRVLDVGCGTGGWLIETAKTYPTIERLVGADISSKMLTYARDQAKAQQLDGRVEFHTMDALRMLEFPPASFDLINLRLASSWIRTWEWTKMLLECQRVTRPGGIIRITDTDLIESNSPAFTKFTKIFLEAYYRSGRFFVERNDGLTSEFVRLLTQHGIQDVKSRVCPLVYQGGTESGQRFYDDMVLLFRMFLPFFQKWTRVPDDYQEICEQSKHEMQHPDFVATWRFLTFWGTRSEDAERLLIRGLK